MNESFTEGKKCLASVIARDNDYEIKMFTKLMRDDYNIEPMDLFKPGFIK